MATNYDDVFNEYVVEFSNLEDARSYTSGGAYEPNYDSANKKAKELTLLSYYTGKPQSVDDWFTQAEWYEYEAPTLVAVLNTPDGSGELEVFTRDALSVNPDFNLIDIDRIANEAGEMKLLETDEQKTAYRQTLKDIYYEKKTAEEKYKRQWSKYGLPNPEFRYGLKADPENGVFVYDKAVQYVADSSINFQKELEKKGVPRAEAEKIRKIYETELTNKLDERLRNSEITPFTVAASRKRGR